MTFLWHKNYRKHRQCQWTCLKVYSKHLTVAGFALIWAWSVRVWCAVQLVWHRSAITAIMSEINEGTDKKDTKCICSGTGICLHSAREHEFTESTMRELREFLLQNETERTAISLLFFFCFKQNSIHTGTINFTIYSRHRSLTTCSRTLFLSLHPSNKFPQRIAVFCTDSSLKCI